MSKQTRRDFLETSMLAAAAVAPGAFATQSSAASHTSPPKTVRFVPLGFLAGGTPNESKAFAVCVHDGEAHVFGKSSTATGQQAVRWIVSGGTVTGKNALGGLTTGDHGGSAHAASDSGEVAVGVGIDPAMGTTAIDGTAAIQWNNSTPNNLGKLEDDSHSSARGYAVDNQSEELIIGRSWWRVGEGLQLVLGDRTAVLWRDGNIEELEHLKGGRDFSMAYGISGNGKVIVGKSDSNHIGKQNTEAVTWKADNQNNLKVKSLHIHGNKPVFGKALAANHRGKVIVGQFYDESVGIPGNPRFAAFRWQSSNIVALKDSPANEHVSSRARDISENKNSAGTEVIVGEFTDNNDEEQAFVWRESDPFMRNLKGVLVAGGETIHAAWKLRQAHGVSNDGTIVVGWGTNVSGETEAWLAELP